MKTNNIQTMNLHKFTIFHYFSIFFSIKENISCNLCANKELSSLESTAPTATNIIEFSLGKTSTVSGHPRNLPSGHKPSEKQLEIARSLGINLADNQTYVTDYSRKIA